MNVVTTDLRTMYYDNLLPESGVIILLSCRYDFDKSKYGQEQYLMDIAPLGGNHWLFFRWSV